MRSERFRIYRRLALVLLQQHCHDNIWELGRDLYQLSGSRHLHVSLTTLLKGGVFTLAAIRFGRVLRVLGMHRWQILLKGVSSRQLGIKAGCTMQGFAAFRAHATQLLGLRVLMMRDRSCSWQRSHQNVARNNGRSPPRNSTRGNEILATTDVNYVITLEAFIVVRQDLVSAGSKETLAEPCTRLLEQLSVRKGKQLIHGVGPFHHASGSRRTIAAHEHTHHDHLFTRQPGWR
mmetsp:Transcript_26315/g.55212  ORF Transcript_26315/g.55212 Transcript_26315/m.55212 type:complete len:233 (-) Transcript_26315:110-808(-)